MEVVLNLRDGKGWGFMESNLRHGYQASLLVFADLDLPDLIRCVLKTFIWRLEMSSSYIKCLL